MSGNPPAPWRNPVYPNAFRFRAVPILMILALLYGCSSATPATPTASPVPEATATSTPQPPTYIYLIALEDNGKSGKAVGCGDSVIPVQVEIPQGADPVTAALTALFSIKDQHVGESGLYNALYQSNLAVDGIEIDAQGKATVRLKGTTMLGGVCDDPRFGAQIMETILQFPQVKEAAVFINDAPLEYLLSEK